VPHRQRSCIQCGVMFTPLSSLQTYCLECRAVRVSEREAEEAAQRERARARQREREELRLSQGRPSPLPDDLERAVRAPLLAGLKLNWEKIRKLSPGEQERIAEQLRALEREYRENPLLRYSPHPKQVQFHSPPFPYARLFLGGNRSGKTTATMIDTLIQAVDAEIVPEHLAQFKRWQPPFFARVITPDLSNTLEGVVIPKLREWCPKKQLHRGGFANAFDKILRILHFQNGSWIQFFSNDQDLDKFGGAALHRVVYDEEPRSDIRRECLMRLIDFGGEEIFGMTPVNGMSWVFDEFYDPWERGQIPPDDTRIVTVDMDDNPHLDEVTKRRVLKGLSNEEREARKSGRFVAFAGLIYPQFSTQKHLVPELDQLPQDEPIEIFRGIDPGVRHLCAVLYAYLDQSDDLVIFDEIALEGRTVKQIVEEMNLRNVRWGRERDDGTVASLIPAWTVIDPAARNRNSQTGRSDAQEFHDHGVFTVPGQNAVTAGINRVRERLDAGKLKVAVNCVELRREFKRYRWTRQATRTEHDPRPTPVKKDDHCLDVLRYICMARPLAPDEDAPLPTLTMKDRLLRESLKALSGPQMAENGFGPGVFA